MLQMQTADSKIWCMPAGYVGTVTAVSAPCFSDPGMTDSNMQVDVLASLAPHQVDPNRSHAPVPHYEL